MPIPGCPPRGAPSLLDTGPTHWRSAGAARSRHCVSTFPVDVRDASLTLEIPFSAFAADLRAPDRLFRVRDIKYRVTLQRR